MRMKRQSREARIDPAMSSGSLGRQLLATCALGGATTRDNSLLCEHLNYPIADSRLLMPVGGHPRHRCKVQAPLLSYCAKGTPDSCSPTKQSLHDIHAGACG